MSSNAAARSLFSALVLVAGSVVAPAATLTWDANGTTAGVTDGAGAWLTANRWWDGSSTITWTSGNDAVFGVGGTGGAVTLSATTSVASLTFNTFLGTYTLGTLGTTLTVDAGGLTMNSGSGTVSIISPVALGAAQSWTNNKATTLTVSGIVGNGGNTLTVSGSGPSTLSGVISGAGGLTKSGDGLLTLSAANTYTGATTVSGGVLRLSSATALPGGINATGGVSALTLNGGVLELGNANFLRNLGSGTTQFQITGGTSGFSAFGAARTVTVNDNAATAVTWGSAEFNPGTFVLNGSTATGAITFSNPIDLNGETRTVAVNANTATLSGVLSGAGTGLTKIGAGTLTLSAANTYSGATTISAGTLTLGNASALGDGSGNLTMSGGVLNLGSFNVTRTGTVSFTGGTVQSGTIINNTVAYDVQSGTTATTATLAGSAGLIKSGAGTMTLTGAVTYTGETTVNGGTLVFNNSAQKANAVVTVNNGGTMTLISNAALSNGTVTVNAGGLLYVNSNTNNNSTFSTLTLNGGTVSSTTGGRVHNAGAIRAGGSTTSTITSAVGNSTNSFTYNMYVEPSSTLLISGQVQLGAPTNIKLTKHEAGTLILSASNAYNGLTTVSAGIVNIRNSNALGTTAVGTTVTTNAALEVQGDITVGAEALTLNGSGISSGGALRNISGNNTYGGAITLGSAARINSDAGTLTLDVASGNAVAGAYNLTFGGAGNVTVADAIATSAVIKDGAGTLTLSGASGSFGGPITVSAGTLAAASSTALGTGAVSIASGGSLRLDPGAILANVITTSTTGSILFAGGGLQRTSTQAVGTVAQLVAGSTGASAALDPDFAWSARIADLTYSDVLDLTNTSGTIQILQMTYGESLLNGGSEADILLGWKSGAEWVNAIDGNTGSVGGLALTNADGGYAAFGILPTADYLGSWGRDTTAKTVWAVVNHNSEYSSIIVVPEPGTLALACVGIAVAGALFARRRRG